MSSSPDRRVALLHLIEQALPPSFQRNDLTPLVALPGDAGFRRYYRLHSLPSILAVDAPPEHEDCETFVRIDLLLRGLGVHAPKVYAVDYQQGFMLIEDLGQQHYQEAMTADNSDDLYAAALDALFKIQSCSECPIDLPHYSPEKLRSEMELFPHWFLQELLGLACDAEDQALLDHLFNTLVASARVSTQGLVHRDYHVRNLMATETPPGIIDFQDAVWGPLTYDLVSLLRDCYVRWPEEILDNTLEAYRCRLVSSGRLPIDNADAFRREFDWMGLQRHIKVLGIFARLALRDQKSSYLHDLPLVIRYTLEVSARYPETEAFHHWFLQKVLPLAESQTWYRNWQTAGNVRP